MTAEAVPQPRPFTAFNFRVVLTVPNVDRPLCDAAFAECDGLEMTMQPKTIQEGGNNAAQIHLAGPLTYGQLTLRRGMTSSFDLWDWFDRVAGGNYALRAEGIVVMLASQRGDRDVAQAAFRLTRCLPARIKAPPLNAREGQVAIEELAIAYERLSVIPPGR